MLGLITKDLFQIFFIRKQRMNFLFYYLVFALGLLQSKNIYGLVFSMLIWMPFIITPILIQVSTELDGKSNYYKVLLTMPITRKDIISSKYFLGILFTCFNGLISLLGILIHLYVFKSIGFDEGFYFLISSLILSLFSISINYFSYILLGSRGIFVNGALTVVVLIGYYFNPSFLQIEQWVKTITLLKPIELIGLGLTTSITCLLISYLLSIIYFSKRELN